MPTDGAALIPSHITFEVMNIKWFSLQIACFSSIACSQDN